MAGSVSRQPVNPEPLRMEPELEQPPSTKLRIRHAEVDDTAMRENARRVNFMIDG